jgi:hypothetical protein
VAKLKYDGREFEMVRNGTFQEASDIETESGISSTAMTDAQNVASALLITLRRNGIHLTWADIMSMDSDLFDIVWDEKTPDPTEAAAPAPRVPQDRKPRKAPARRGGAAGGSRAG